MRKKYICSTRTHYFKKVFDTHLVDFVDAEPTDVEGQLDFHFGCMSNDFLLHGNVPSWIAPLRLRSLLTVSLQASRDTIHSRKLSLTYSSCSCAFIICSWISIHHSPCPTISKMSLISFLTGPFYSSVSQQHWAHIIHPPNVYWMKKEWVDEL